MSDNNLKFSFYEKTKWEDCNPYLSDNLIVVCDGCGGAGGYLLNTDESLIDSYEKIKKVVLPESNDEEIDNLIKEYFEPIYSNPKEKRTSAFWGSRIAMARYVYFMKSNQNPNLVECKDFIKNGMIEVKKKLNFNEPDVVSKRMLPTTMVSILLNSEEENEINIEVNWAGDSRAYTLSNMGLKLLSIDNESRDGGLTNYFSGKEDFDPTICHREYKLEKPCIVFVCSDGLFDNYSDLDFECLLLEAIVQSNSIEDLKNILINFYKKNKEDDCTMSLLSFGFKNFEELKEYFKERESYITNLYTNYNENKFAVNLKKYPESFNNIYEKIFNRTKDKLKNICEEISNNQDDESMKELIDLDLFNVDLELKNRLNDVKSKYSNMIKDYLNEHGDDINPYEVFNEDIIKNSSALLNEYDKILKEKENLKNKIQSDKEKRDKYTEYSTILKLNIDKILDSLNETNLVDLSISKDNLYHDIENGNINLDKFKSVLEIISSLLNNPNFKDEFINSLNEFNEIKNIIHEENEADLYRKEDLKNIVIVIYSNQEDNLDCINELANNKEIKEILNEYNTECNTIKENAPSLENELFNYLSNFDNLNAFVTNRLKIGEKETIIDKFYNIFKLNEAINFYKVLNNDDKLINRISEELDNYDIGFKSLIFKNNDESV